MEFFLVHSYSFLQTTSSYTAFSLLTWFLPSSYNIINSSRNQIKSTHYQTPTTLLALRAFLCRPTDIRLHPISPPLSPPSTVDIESLELATTFNLPPNQHNTVSEQINEVKISLTMEEKGVKGDKKCGEKELATDSTTRWLDGIGVRFGPTHRVTDWRHKHG